MSLIFLDTKSSVVTSRVITWNASQLITLLIMNKYNAQEPRTVNTINNGNITLLYVYYITTLLYRVYKKNATSEFPKKSLCNS
jgi:hypothetical protein